MLTGSLDVMMIGTDRALFAKYAAAQYTAAMDVVLRWRTTNRKGTN